MPVDSAIGINRTPAQRLSCFLIGTKHGWRTGTAISAARVFQRSSKQEITVAVRDIDTQYRVVVLAFFERDVRFQKSTFRDAVKEHFVVGGFADGFSPAHLDLEPFYAHLAGAGVPVILHIGGGQLLPRAYHRNGRPTPTDWRQS